MAVVIALVATPVFAAGDSETADLAADSRGGDVAGTPFAEMESLNEAIQGRGMSSKSSARVGGSA